MVDPRGRQEAAARPSGAHHGRRRRGRALVRPRHGAAASVVTDETAKRAELRERFDAAVRDRLVADVPVGAFLSGGIDSALVAASMVRAAPEVRTFTVGFAGAASYYEERPAARAVARHLGTEHTEIELVGRRDRARARSGVRRASTSPSPTARPCRPGWSRARRASTSPWRCRATAPTRCSAAIANIRANCWRSATGRCRRRCAARFEGAIAWLPEGKGNVGARGGAARPALRRPCRRATLPVVRPAGRSR